MMSRNSGTLRYPYSARDQTSGEKRAGRSPRPDRYARGPGARTPKAMSASLASAMMKAREQGLARISASLVSSNLLVILLMKLGTSRFGIGTSLPSTSDSSRLHFRQGFFQRSRGLLQRHLLVGPQLDFN